MVTELKNHDRTYYRCGVCGFSYRERETAERCQAWCQEHKSCNLEIIAHALNPQPEEPTA